MRLAYSRFVIVAAGLLVTGCPKVEPDPTGQSKAPGQPGLGGHVRRGMDRHEILNDLRNLTQMYHIFHTNSGGAADMEAFKMGLRDSPKLFQAVQEGRYVLRPVRTLGSNIVFAYERDLDLNGNRYVAMADGTVRLVSDQESKQLLQNG